ncbi:hypothetical protein AgCh_024139 [Apium graveolens]
MKNVYDYMYHTLNEYAKLMKYVKNDDSATADITNDRKMTTVEKLNLDTSSSFVLLLRTPTPVLKGKTPYEVLFNKPPDFDYQRVFGSLYYASTLPATRDKFETCASNCVFLGYLYAKKGYRVFDLHTRRVFVSRHVKFVEHILPFLDIHSTTLPPLFTESSSSLYDPLAPATEDPSPPADSFESARSSPVHVEIPAVTPSPPPPPPPPHLPVTRYVRVKHLPHKFADYTAALEANHTWEVVPYTPDKRVVDCKWLYKVKYLPNGEVDRYKTRLVVKGFTQTEGLDYFDTFAPVAKMTTFRVILALSAQLQWSITQLDAPGCWFVKLSVALSKFGVHQARCDHSLFVFVQGQSMMTLLVYVDDMFLAGNDVKFMQTVKDFPANNFKIKDLGSLKYFLGIEVARSDFVIYINQRKYTLDILKDVHCESAKPSVIPMEHNLTLALDDSLFMADPTVYRRLVGRLIYLTITRPDISYYVHFLSQFLQAPQANHMQAAMKLVKYLKGTCGQGLFFPAKLKHTLQAFCDADWGACRVTRQSITGYGIKLDNVLVN